MLPNVCENVVVKFRLHSLAVSFGAWKLYIITYRGYLSSIYASHFEVSRARLFARGLSSVLLWLLGIVT
jgi:hypothetical protein